MWDPSCICDLHHSSQQCWILNPLSKARDQTGNLLVPSWIRSPLSHYRNSYFHSSLYYFLPSAFWEVLFALSFLFIQVIDLRFFFFLFLAFWLFVFSRAAPLAYGGSQARGLIEAVASGLRQSHSSAGSELHLNLHHSSRQRQILNPLNKARDRTHNLMVSSQIH